MGVTVKRIDSNLSMEYWQSPDGLIMLEGWSRDGYTIQDIADRIGIAVATVRSWMNKSEDIKKAIDDGRELVDYKVENALLKAALGYTTKEVRITTVIKEGVVVEKTKETVTKEAAPNVAACKTWLFNRQPKKWKAESARANLLDNLDEDTDVRIVIERAGNKNQDNDIDQQWQDEVNQSVVIRSATEEERKENIRKQREQKKKKAQANKNTIVQYDDDSTTHGMSMHNNAHGQQVPTHNSVDVDYWPDDWEDDE